MVLLEGHGDCVLRLPPTAVRLGTSSSCLNEIWLDGFDSNILAFQSHPELFPADLTDKILPAISGKRVIDDEQTRSSERALASFEVETERDDAFVCGASPLPSGGAPLHSNRLIALFRTFLRHAARVVR